MRAQACQALESIHTELWLPAELQPFDLRQGTGGSGQGGHLSLCVSLANGLVRFDPKAVKPADLVLLTDSKVSSGREF